MLAFKKRRLLLDVLSVLYDGDNTMHGIVSESGISLSDFNELRRTALFEKCASYSSYSGKYRIKGAGVELLIRSRYKKKRSAKENGESLGIELAGGLLELVLDLIFD